jgi:bifunctional non-homologous end joining protein LigD
VRVPAAMLARSGPMPDGGGWSFEVKWDGFRCLVDTHEGFRAVSRRRWRMESLLPELEAMPSGLVLDGELVAFRDGLTDFPLLCDRMLHRGAGIAITYLGFHVLAVEGLSTMTLPLRRLRELLDELDLTGPTWHTPPWFDDGQALWTVVCDQGLEGVVAKRLDTPYRTGRENLSAG